jgi:hypothetical protein
MRAGGRDDLVLVEMPPAAALPRSTIALATIEDDKPAG